MTVQHRSTKGKARFPNLGLFGIYVAVLFIMIVASVVNALFDFYSFSHVGTGKADSDIPLAPGEVRLISIERVGPNPYAYNLIRNGYFSEWLTGLGYPAGFQTGGKQSASRLTRKLGSPRFDVLQVWTRPDAGDGLTDRFRTRVEGLRKNTYYRLEIEAECLTCSGVGVTVYSGGLAPVSAIAEDLIELLPSNQLGTSYVYSADFFTGEHQSIWIASGKRSAAGSDASVLWRYWRLFEPAPDSMGTERLSNESREREVLP